MKRDERLERLSDCVRRGEPIAMMEALEVIEYQGRLQEHRRQNSLVAKVKRFLTGERQPAQETR